MEGKIYKAIVGVMNDVGAVKKTDKNPQQGYRYRGIDAVMNALQPAMIKNGIYVVPQVISQEREERTTSKGGLLIYSIVRVKYIFYADDGSYVEAMVIGEGMDSGDKSSNKAMSAAFKYACFQTFCIPTEEMLDSEKEDPEPVPKSQQKISVDDARKIKLMLEETNSDVKGFLSYFKVPSVDDLTVDKLRKAYDMLNSKYKKAVNPE